MSPPSDLSLTLASVFQPLFTLAGICVTAWGVTLANAAIGLAHRRLHLDLSTAQERDVRAAINSAAGALVAELAQGGLALSQINTADINVRALAQHLISTTPPLGETTVDAAAQRIVGAVGLLIAADPTTKTVPTPSPGPSPAATPYFTVPFQTKAT